MTDVRELIERYRRWLIHTGYDGGVNSPPMLVLDALTAALEREEALREALRNARGFIDTPVMRQKHHDDWMYAPVVESIRAALENTNGK